MTSKRLVAAADMKVPTPGAQKYLQVYIPMAWCMFAIVGTIALRVTLHLVGSNADFTVLSIFVSFMVCVMSWIYGSSVGWYAPDDLHKIPAFSRAFAHRSYFSDRVIAVLY